MSILASDVITYGARKLWGTALSAEKTDDVSSLKWLSQALRSLYSARPDAAIDDDGNYYPYVAVTAIGQSIPVSDKFLPYLIDYVTARGFQEDGENPAHQKRAGDHFELAKAWLNI